MQVLDIIRQPDMVHVPLLPVVTVTTQVHCMGLEPVIRKEGQEVLLPYPGAAKCAVYEKQRRTGIRFIGKMTDDFQVCLPGGSMNCSRFRAVGCLHSADAHGVNRP